MSVSDRWVSYEFLTSCEFEAATSHLFFLVVFETLRIDEIPSKVFFGHLLTWIHSVFESVRRNDRKTEAKRSFFYCCDYIASAATTKFFK